MHPEWANIRFILSGFWSFTSARTTSDSATAPGRVYGPASFTTKVHGERPSRTVGIGLPANEYADRIVSVTEIFPDAAGRMQRALTDAPDDPALRVLFDGFYLKVHESRPEPSPVLKRAHAPLPPIASPLVAPQGPIQA